MSKTEQIEKINLAETYPLYLANEAQSPNTDLEVVDKFTGKVATKVAVADADMVNEAIDAAVAAQKEMAKLPSYKRKEILLSVVEQLRERHEELSQALCIEAGKPIKDARGEVTRAIDTFTIAAEEAVRNYGEWAPMDISSRAHGFQSITRRFPIGPIGMISPFNFPINLAAHKIAPAIAAGSSFVLKPASRTPIGALLMGEMLAKTDLPKGAFSILPCSREAGDLLTTDERIEVLSFTGSPGVGWSMKERAGKKKVVLELGGNAACVVDADADIDAAVKRIMIGAFYQSGQSCIGVQRILAHVDIYDELKEKLAAAASELKMGDPRDPETFIGPMITENDAKRCDEWVQEAVERGGTIIAGGNRKGQFYEATLVDVDGIDTKGLRVVDDEVFGPVAVLTSFKTFEQAVELVNDSVFGLQAGVFTNNLQNAFYAFENMVVGGVVIGDVPSVRVDAQAYGGVKDSGLGREGIRYAMKDFSEERVMMLKGIGGGSWA